MFLHVLYEHMEWVPGLEKQCFAFVRMFLVHVFGACFCMFWHFHQGNAIFRIFVHIFAYFGHFWQFLNEKLQFYEKNARKIKIF
jgi:hypothetical protein